MVRVSEIAQEGPGGAPYRFGGSPRGEGPPRLRTRGGPHTRPTPCGVGQPRLRLGIVAQNARTKVESIHDRGKGGVWGVEEYHPTSTRTHPPPRAKKL